MDSAEGKAAGFAEDSRGRNREAPEVGRADGGGDTRDGKGSPSGGPSQGPPSGGPSQGGQESRPAGSQASRDAVHVLFEYLRDVIYNPLQAKLDPNSLSGPERNLGLGIMFLAECIGELRAFANALARGDLGAPMPSAGNEIAAPLKTLYSSMKHLTWQAQQIAAGDYSQHVDFMGEFSDSFNAMIRQLDQRNHELVMAKITAEAASRAKSAFLGAVSHEMRTPLNAILGLSALELQRENLPTLSKLNLEKIWNAGSSLLRIVNDILDIARAGAGKFELVPVDYSILDLLNDVVQVNIVRAGSKPISFELTVDETIPSRLSGDSLRVKQILNNILSNAFKYTERGKVRFRVGWSPAGGGSGADMIFTVSDTGIGIRPENLERIFTDHSQINSQANRYVEGTGLGLAITKYLVDLMGGNISAESEFGAGSEFKAVIPQKIVHGTPIGRAAAEDLANFRTMARGLSVEGNLVRTLMPYGHVLLVDDVPTNLDVAEGLLSPYGIKVSAAHSGREAVDLVAAVRDDSPPSERFDLILMDHMMPDMDGVEAVRNIRSLPAEYARKVPVIAFTASAAPETVKMFLDNGFNSFISKPIDILELDAALNRWVRRDSAFALSGGGSPGAQESPGGQGAQEAPAPEGGVAAGGPGDGPAGGPAAPGRPAVASGRAAALSIQDFNIEGLDIQSGIGRFGREDKFIKVLKSYILHTPKLLENLKASARSSLSDYAISVHGLKGSSYGISADAVGDVAARLEAMAKEGKTESFADSHLLLMEKAEKLIGDISSAIARIEAAEGAKTRQKLAAPDPDLLVKLLDAARRGKTSQMEDLTAQLELYDYERQPDLVPFIREKLEAFDYQLICDRLHAVLEE
ncbi:MAG: response regulator [Deltaproteobacteria bacterium]|jgi:signal transduction histidine kinase/CheY-like chemotaxis protein/HPt (histidine-containing phosphotransfer) domain-containing protein|nr:response regulator [Deltaproteobacteria bacterium]